MKIKKLTIQNINSIYGKWEINFQNPEYLDNPLFAIIGKTGSGKTTILDAISFALYDQTDRMENMRAAIASRGTTECMAELNFEINGVDYTAYSALKAKTKSENKGKFDNDLGKNSWIQWEENGPQKREGTTAKKAKVIELLGLDFKKFRQVILLAQGKFNAFLKADTEERSAILENITGTQIYSNIGKQIKGMYDEFTNRLENLKLRQEGISILSEEAVQEKNDRLKAIQDEEEKNSGRLKAVEALLKTVEAKDKCEATLKGKEKEDEDLTAEETAFEQEKPRLEAARVAEKIVPAFEEHKKCAEEQERDKSSFEKTNGELPQLQTEANNAAKASQEAEEQFLLAKGTQESREIELKAIDDLDREIEQKRKDFAASKKTCLTLSTHIKDSEAQRAELAKSLKELDDSKSLAERYLQEHAQDQDLENKIEGWKVTLTSLKKDGKELTNLHEQEKLAITALTEAEKAVTDDSKAIEKTREKEAEKTTALQHASDELKSLMGGKTLEELEEDCNEQQKVVSLLQALNPKEVLGTFHEGDKCPVCGSTHHPYRELPSDEMPDLIKAQKKLETIKGQYDKAKVTARGVENATHALEKIQMELKSSLAQLELKRKTAEDKRRQLEETQKTLAERQSRYDDAETALHGDMKQFGFDLGKNLALPKEIQSRMTEYMTQKALVEGFERQRAAHLQKVAALDGELGVNRQNLSAEQTNKENLQKEIDAKTINRKEKYGEHKTSDERKALQKATDTANEAKMQTAKQAASSKTNVENAQKACEQLQTAMEARKPVLEEKQELLANALTDNEMSMEAFLASRLPQEEFGKLTALETSLKTRRETLTKELVRLKTEFETHKAKLSEDFDVQATQTEKSELEAKGKQLAEERGGINQQLLTNEDNLKKMGDLLKEIAAAQKLEPLWKNLNSWLGGTNGRAFKMMAQKYTFDNLLVKANEQLRTMLGGRYQMCSHQESDNLEIDVIDNQLGGDLRTSQNLSGGEQFVISMALALGLASMVGERFKVDSLFLDEGFGTLDGNELEEAMNTLSRLKGDGKLVGIITHAERLQERIPTRIELHKGGNGRSTLTGPGVNQLEAPRFFMSDEEKALRAKLQKEERARQKQLQKEEKERQKQLLKEEKQRQKAIK